MIAAMTLPSETARRAIASPVKTVTSKVGGLSFCCMSLNPWTAERKSGVSTRYGSS